MENDDFMKWTTIQDYADLKAVSYQAIRQQLARYREEIGEEHFRTYQRKLFMDEYAVSFLDEKRKVNPVIIYDQSKDDRITELERTVEELTAKIDESRQLVIDSQQTINELNVRIQNLQEAIISLSHEKLMLVQKTTAADMLEYKLQKTEEELNSVKEERDAAVRDSEFLRTTGMEQIRSAKAEADSLIGMMEQQRNQAKFEADQIKKELQKEKESYKRTWFGLYRRV